MCSDPRRHLSLHDDNPRYLCTFKKTVALRRYLAPYYEGKDLHTFLVKQCTLPFFPVAGMTIDFQGPGADGFDNDNEDLIEHVHYCATTGALFCRCKDREMSANDAYTEEDYTKYIEELKSVGWEDPKNG